jgi:hypothetical protein
LSAAKAVETIDSISSVEISRASFNIVFPSNVQYKNRAARGDAATEYDAGVHDRRSVYLKLRNDLAL